MASIALSVVGFAVGGPFGAAIGSIIGQQLDPLIFGSGPAREGPRLKELDVQTSSYGTAIPRVYGRLRVAGTVIWATDLKESKRTQGAKGQPDIVTYSYSASFAIALSSRPIATVGRIWADGRLIRGADGTPRFDGKMRVHPGNRDRAVDPLIAAAEGASHAPAHRGLAYILFEDLQLAEFGNRIPSITVEVVADEGAIDSTRLLADLGGIGADPGAPVLPLVGYAASGPDRRSALAPLLAVLPCRIADDGTGILRCIADPGGDGGAPVIVEPLADPDDRPEAGRTAVRIDDDGRSARSLSLRHYDPARDYQAGLQRSDRPGAAGIDTQIDLPAAMAAADALDLAQTMMRRQRRERHRWEGRIARPQRPLVPGSVLRPDAGPGADRDWLVLSVAHDADHLTVEAVGLSAGRAPRTPAVSPGRAVADLDIPVPPTRAALIELPPPADRLADGPLLALAACGAGAGWRGANAALRLGPNLLELGPLPRGAALGVAETHLPPASPAIRDLGSHVDILLAGGAGPIGDADDGQLDIGVNLAVLGREVLQFGSARPLGNDRWRLSRLRRAVRGDPETVYGHAIGEAFVLLELATLLPVPAVIPVGGTVAAEVAGLGDTEPLRLAGEVEALAIRPPPPVHLFVERRAAVRRVRWTRRARLAQPWQDGVDQPLGEERETYRLRWSDSGGTLLGDVLVDRPFADLPPDAPPHGVVMVSQIGSLAASSFARTFF